MLIHILKFIFALVMLNALPAVFGQFGFVVSSFIILCAIWKATK